MNLTATALRHNILTSKILAKVKAVCMSLSSVPKARCKLLKPCRNFVRMSFSGLNPGSYTIVCIRKVVDLNPSSRFKPFKPGFH